MLYNQKINEEGIVNELLRKTSRSFYLSIHYLPSQIRWPISLAYLLARATDTIADVVDIPSSEKLSLLAGMNALINNPNIAQPALNSFFSSLPTTTPENELLHYFSKLINHLEALDENLRQDIVTTLNTIIKGQVIDLETFTSTKEIACFSSIQALDTYTYLVAGCVGEFWTNICYKLVPGYSRQPISEMTSLAISFGKGLQLVNILRDIPSDLNNGRCYFPEEQLKEIAIDMHDIAKNINLLNPIVTYWQGKAIDDLRQGWSYMLQIKQRRVRTALVLPLLLGFATLQELQEAWSIGINHTAKVSRQRLKIFLCIAVLGFISPKFLKLVRFTKLSTMIGPWHAGHLSQKCKQRKP